MSAFVSDSGAGLGHVEVRPDVAAKLAEAEAGRLYRAAREIRDLAQVVMDASRGMNAGGVPRARAKMREIAAQCAGWAE